VVGELMSTHEQLVSKQQGWQWHGDRGKGRPMVPKPAPTHQRARLAHLFSYHHRRICRE
jgi:hypothetical protein